MFQGRYKAHHVEDAGHYTEISRYIHLNPVRAGLVRDRLEYPWSSFPGCCRRSQELDWVTYERVLGEQGPGSRAVRQRRYGAFVRGGMKEDLRPPW